MSRTGRMILVAQFGAAHGVRGEVRLKSFTANPADVALYSPLTAKDGRAFEITSARPAAGSSSPDMLVVRVKGIEDRNAAEALNRLELSVPYERLPQPEEGEFFHADLIGLAARSPEGAALGTVVGVENYGAGDLLEIAPGRGGTYFVPFTEAHVPTVDVAGGYVVIIPPVYDTDEAGGDGAPDVSGEAEDDEGGTPEAL